MKLHAIFLGHWNDGDSKTFQQETLTCFTLSTRQCKYLQDQRVNESFPRCRKLMQGTSKLFRKQKEKEDKTRFT